MKDHDFEKQIDYIIKHFNFNNVHEYMLLNKWFIGKDVPSPHQLKEIARLLLKTIANSKGSAHGQLSGFHAVKVNNRLKLIFGFESINLAYEPFM